MSTYSELRFSPVSRDMAEMLIARLAAIGFEGFEEEGDALKAYILEADLAIEELEDIVGLLGVKYTRDQIEHTNWNAWWESSFDPVIVDDFVAVRADFHPEITEVRHDIIITPKMSFGTGHHATTFLMMQAMRDIDFQGKSVFDFGTGTGVLAILAEKLGAQRILAIDNDEWSILNTQENLCRNACTRVQAVLTDKITPDMDFDIILANINKNVILEHLGNLAARTKPGAIIVLSGLLSDDEEEVVASAHSLGLNCTAVRTRDNWLLLKLSH
jgi:ribosomal protein L11 methyltransferase